MRELITLADIKSNEAVPVWELEYRGSKEIFGNDISKAVARIDWIYEEAKGDVEIHIHGFTNSTVAKEIKKVLFAGKPYYNKILHCLTIPFDENLQEFTMPMKKKVTLMENVVPMWELKHEGGIEFFGDCLDEVIKRIDHIYDEAKGNIEIIVKQHNIIAKEIFLDKPYYNNIKICRLSDIDSLKAEYMLGTKEEKYSFCDIKDIIPSAFENLSASATRGFITGVSTGLKSLDKLTSGFQSSDLIIISGVSGVGKTSLALNIARYVAVDNKIPVAIFSPGMDKEQLTQRMLYSGIGADISIPLSESDLSKLRKSVESLSEAEIFIDDSRIISLKEIWRKAILLKHNKGLQMVIVDSIESITANGEEAGRVLKELAAAILVPVIVLSRIDRECENRPDKRPQITDIRSEIGKYADVVMFVYKNAVFDRSMDNNMDNNIEKGIVEIIVDKNRNGMCGIAKLVFLEKCATFKDLNESEMSFR